ncbi:MAG: hypothetical protein GY832_17585, partial [Chloroflexi bacterium]|nr:hypothetical protein [Chloroflexota bacterium]
MTERNPYLPDAYSEAIIAAGSKKTNPYLPTDDGMDAALSVALRTDPDRTARAHTLSAKTGIPISTVERNPEAAEKQAQLSDMKSQVDQISPLGRGWLIDPANAALVKDDMDSVSMLDEIWNTVGTVAGHAGNALKRGALRVGQGFNQFVAEESAEQALDAERSFGEIIGDQLGGYRSVPNPIDLLQSGERYASSRLFGGAQEAAHARLRNVGEFARRIQETPKSPTAEASQNAILEAGKKGFMPAIDAVLEDPLGAMALGTEIALEFVPQLAISSVATATGGPASGAATLGLTSAFTERYSSPAEFLAERGYDLTDPEEVNRALEDPALLRAAASYGFTRGLIIGTFDAASGGLAGKALSSGIIRNFLLQAVAQAGLGGGGEAAAQYATTGKVDAGEVVLEAVGEFAAAPIEVMGVGGHFAKTRRQKGLLDDQRVAAEEDIDKLKRTRDALSNGKLEGRSTDKVKELINRLTKDGMVYLDVNGADEYFQKSGEDADTWYQWMGVEDQVARARAGEGMIEVSTADFLTVQGIDDHLDGLAADIRLTDGGLTMRQVEQAETFNEKRLNDVLADVRDEDAAREMAQAEAADVVYDDVLSQLNATNVYDIDAARYQATVWQHTIRTLAARTGRDVAELYEQFKPTIKTAIEKEGRFRSDVALERILERVRMNERGELKSSRQSATPVLDHLKTLGGVRKGSNLAGELNAMGITPRTHRGLFKKETDKGALGDVDNLEPRDILAEIQNDGTYADRDAVLESVRREWIDKKPTR